MPCRRQGIFAFSVFMIRTRNGPSAILTLPTAELAKRFIDIHGSMSRFESPKLTLWICGQPVSCRPANKATRDIYVVRSLVEQQNRESAFNMAPMAAEISSIDGARKPEKDKTNRSFPINGFELGVWAPDTLNNMTTAFNPRYLVRRDGALIFRPESVVIDLEPAIKNPYGTLTKRYTLVMYYHQVYQVVTDGREDVFISLITAPRIYHNIKTADPNAGERVSRERVPGIDDAHEAYSGFSLVYKVTLKNGSKDHTKVLRLGGTRGIVPITPRSIVTRPPKMDFLTAFQAQIS